MTDQVEPPQEDHDYPKAVKVFEKAKIGSVLRAELCNIPRSTELRWRKGMPIRNREKYRFAMLIAVVVQKALKAGALPLKHMGRGKKPEELKRLILEAIKPYMKS